MEALLAGVLILTPWLLPTAAYAGGAAPATAVPESNGNKKELEKLEAQNPTPIRQWQIDAGYLSSFRKGLDDSFYYSVNYKGNLLRQKGTPLAFSKFNERIVEPNKDRPDGDTSDISFELDRGGLGIDGGVFDLLGVKKITLPGEVLRNYVRGTAQGSGRLDGKQINVSAGLESTPLHPVRMLGLKNTYLTNWVVFGVQGQHENRSGSVGDDQDAAIATYRAFVGRGFGWTSNKKLQEAAFKALRDAVLAKAKTLTEAIPQADVIEPQVARDASDDAVPLVDRIIRRGVRRNEKGPDPVTHKMTYKFGEDDAAKWDEWVTDYISGSVAARERPTVTLWLESAGWYYITSVSDAKRFNNLVALTGTWFLNPTAEKPTFIRLRYENGRERAAPTERKHFVAVTVGLNF